MRGALTRWRVALRIARRSALTSWGRSLLIVALVAAPIAGLAGAAVFLPSTQSTLQERIDGTLGHAQARIQVVAPPDAHLRQAVEGGYDYAIDDDAGQDERRVDPRTLLPAADRVLAIGTASATFQTARGAVSLAVTTGPSWDPSLNGGPYALLSGRRPTSADEVLLSPAALSRLGARVGGSVRMLVPVQRVLRVVGTSRDRAQPSSAQTVFASASAVPVTDARPEATAFYVPTTSIGWSAVQRLNRAGATVFSREVVLHPPASSEVLQSGGGGWISNASVAVTVALAVAFAVLEVALLAGSAFLVGARQQQRMLATIASVGADRSVLRRVVTAGGVVLGALGGTAGLVLGIVGALVLMHLTDDGTWIRYPGVHLIWPLLVGIVLFGVLVGWSAALVPARAAARFDVVRALRGARTPQRVGRRPVAGIGLLAAGIVCTMTGGGALFAALRTGGPGETTAQLGALVLLGGGPVLAQVGVLLCAGLVLRGVAAVVGRGPLAARLAARDTARNLGRAVPAVAAVMTTVFAAAFVMCLANAASLSAAQHYGWLTARIGQGYSTISTSGDDRPTRALAARWTDVLRRDLPVASPPAVLSTTVEGPAELTSNRVRDAVAQVRFPEPARGCDEAARIDPANLRCGPFTANGGGAQNAQPSVTVGSLSALAALLGHEPSRDAQKVLANGGAVALRSDVAPNGAATVQWFTPKQFDGDLTTARPRRLQHLDAVVDLPDHPLWDSLFVSSATARTLGLDARPERVLLSFTRTPSDQELDAASSALSALTNTPDQGSVRIEHGPQDYGSQIAWWILLACLVIAISAGATAVGLARVDGRADDATLASLGAARRIRRTVGAVQALIVCGLGAVVGTVLGLLPAAALGAATTSLPFVPPTLQLALTAVGIPAVIAAGCWLLIGTRRADLTRRTAIA